MNSQIQVPTLAQDDYGLVIQMEFDNRRSEIESQLELLSSDSEEYRKIAGELASLELQHRQRLTGIAYCLLAD